MSKKENALHMKVGKIFQEVFKERLDFELVRDKACGGNQRVPLFYVSEKSRECEFCNVDLMVLKKNGIRIIAEIEESNRKPTQVCGKFLTSALARYYIHETKSNKPIKMNETVTFIQIVGTSRLVKDKTCKPKQWKVLEESLNRVLPLKGSRITEYKLFNADELSELTSFIEKIT